MNIRVRVATALRILAASLAPLKSEGESAEETDRKPISYHDEGPSAIKMPGPLVAPIGGGGAGFYL